jgi:hypothetical protein
MSLHTRVTFSLLILFALSASIAAQAPAAPTYLPQGWTDAQRQQFYTTSQGSQLIPLSWFLALERPASEDLFTIDQMSRFGFLPNPQSALNNPNGLPVGFAEDRNDGGWAGLTCSACHTGQVEYRGAVLRIDGGPSSADVLAFVTELNASLQATLNDPVKFTRFAAKVAGSDPRLQHDLRNQLTRFAAYFSTFLDTSTPDSPWGPARVDAFGMIFNRASSIDLSDATLWSWFQPLESNAQKPNAPVSYPFLWGTSRQDHVQWNAVARNKYPYERLGRNIGEALGVFARVNIRKPATLEHGYASSVNIPNQLMIEETLIHSLKSPQWPAATLGAIDQTKAAQGATLYKKFCSSCHAITDRNGTSPITVTQTPIGTVATDPTMAMNVACRMADTGILVGTKQPPLLGHKLDPQDYTVNLVANEGVGVLEGWLEGSAERASVSASASAAAKPSVSGAHAQVGAAAPPPPNQAQPSATAISKPALQLSPSKVLFEPSTGTPNNCTGAPKVYKAAPLNGIWATAPYLHNGSVASLYQLLLPAADRLATFKVGSREFDPQNVGFDPTAGPFTLDTSVVGNSNKGHEYATNPGQLTDEQRWQLVEFLKTL